MKCASYPLGCSRGTRKLVVSTGELESGTVVNVPLVANEHTNQNKPVAVTSMFEAWLEAAGFKRTSLHRWRSYTDLAQSMFLKQTSS